MTRRGFRKPDIVRFILRGRTFRIIVIGHSPTHTKGMLSMRDP